MHVNIRFFSYYLYSRKPRNHYGIHPIPEI